MEDKKEKMIRKGILYGFIANFLVTRLYTFFYELFTNFELVQTKGIVVMFPLGEWPSTIWIDVLICGGIVSLIPAVLMGGLLGYLLCKEKIYPFRHFLSVGAGLIVFVIVWGRGAIADGQIGQILLPEITLALSYMISFFFVGIVLAKQLKGNRVFHSEKDKSE
jgi:hypothetical protein